MAITKVTRTLLSTGIDDQSNATAITINSSEQVGIGVSPANKLEIQHGTIGTGNGSNNTLALRYNSTTLYGQHYMDANGFYHIRADAQGVSGGNLILGGDASVQIWTGSTPEGRVVVDSSGRVIVGNTSPFTADSVTIDQGGFLAIRNTSGSGMEVRRDGTDGSLIDFQKDGSPVGSIGIENTGVDLTIDGKSDINRAGIKLGYRALVPRYGGVDTDGGNDLGYPANRWKDLYLSGGAYLGGTGSANKLDDYEEGTWTPSYQDDSGNAITNQAAQIGTYVKVGSFVYIQGALRTQGSSSTSGLSGGLTIAGLPFTAINSVVSNGHVNFHTHESSSSYNAPSELPRTSPIGANTSLIRVYKYSGTGGRTTRFQVSDLNMSGNSNYMFFSGVYRID